MCIKKIFSVLMIAFSFAVFSCSSSLTDIYDVFGDKPFIFVKQGGGGLMDGSSWDNAFADLQLAVNAAQPGQEIWVAKGTTISATITIGKNVIIYGGFSDGDTKRSDRSGKTSLVRSAGILNIYNNYTPIIDGFSFSGATSASAIIITTASPTIQNCEIRDCTTYSCINIAVTSSPVITNCNFINNNSSTNGGAIYASNSSLTVRDCTFDTNTASSASGGAIYSSNCSLTISNCIFNNNACTIRGGAIYASTSDLSVKNSIFTKNSLLSSERGGAVYYNDVSSPKSFTISGCTFGRKDDPASGNSAAYSSSGNGGYGGAVFIVGGTSTKIIYINSTNFYYNKAGSGGAVFFDGNSLSYNRSLIIDHAIFGENKSLWTTSAWSQGGSIMIGSILGTVGILSSIIYNNSSTGDGGGIFASGSGSLSIINSIVTGNQSTGSGTNGGGLYSSMTGGCTLYSSTFTKNSVIDATNSGLSIYTNTSMTAYNSIIWENSSTYAPIKGTGPFVLNNVYLNTSVTGVIDGENINEDSTSPFIDYTGNDFHILNNISQCKDTGNNTYASTIATDLDGKPRIADGTVDIGAYEYQ
jgi:predicted outer membrane repeat protein